MMTLVHVILSLVEGPQKTGVGQAAASRESSPPYRHVGPARNSQGVSPGLMPNKIQHKHFQLEVEAFEGKWDCQRAETSNSSRKTCWSRNYFPSPRIQPQCPPHFSATFRHPPQAAKEPAGFWLTWAICVTTHNSRNSLEAKRLLGLDCVLSIIWTGLPPWFRLHYILLFPRLCIIVWRGLPPWLRKHYTFLSTLDVVNNL